MISFTVKALLGNDLPKSMYVNEMHGCSGVYIFKDGAGDVLYVGKGVDVPTRLYSHIGHKFGHWSRSISLIGQHVLDNLPRSLDWKINVYTLDEMQSFTPVSVDLDTSERIMISMFKPRLNVALNLTGATDATRTSATGVFAANDDISPEVFGDD